MSTPNSFCQPDLAALGVVPTSLNYVQSLNLDLTPGTAIIGVDAEYVSGLDDAGKKNRVISYQTYTIIPEEDCEYYCPFDVEYSPRLDLQQIVVETLLFGKRQGLFKRWPYNLLFISHWSLAEMTSFADFGDLKTQFDGVRRTYISLKSGIPIRFYDENRNRHEAELHLRDTQLLAPAKASSLAKLGETIGLLKLDVSHEEKKDLRMLKQQDPKMYWEYAMRDAEIAARYYLRTLAAAQQMLSSTDVNPTTLGSLAPLLVFKIWKDNEIDPMAVLGKHEVEQKAQSAKGMRTKKVIVDLPKKAQFSDVACKGYMGGRNEAFYFGLSHTAAWSDYDLRGAYIIAMCCIGIPLWSDLRQIQDLSELTPEVLGVAHISFRFPDSVRFPCIPVKTDTGLIFPKSGRCWATAPEIFLARKLGAAVVLAAHDDPDTAVPGFVVPMDFSVRPFDTVATYIDAKRAKYKESDNMLSELYKELGNSVYGKLAQGVKVRMIFNTREGETERMPPSKLTNEYLALHTTGLVRALVSEMLNAIPEPFTVISTTTDGFISDFPANRINELCIGEFGILFSAGRQRVSGQAAILEIKHTVDRVLCFRTRGQATVDADGNTLPFLDAAGHKFPSGKIILAKGGIKTKAYSLLESNNEIVQMFATRTAGQKFESERMRGFRDIYDADGDKDLNHISLKIEYTMDFDWKRKPTEFGVALIAGAPHLQFATSPLEDLAEYERYREGWKGFREMGRVLKSPTDLQDFEDYLAAGSPSVRRKGRGSDSLQTAKKAFLRAYTRELWGVRRLLKNHELAGALTRLGVPTKVHEVENAARKGAKALSGCVEPTPQVLDFLRVVEEVSPGFPCGKVLRQLPAAN